MDLSINISGEIDAIIREKGKEEKNESKKEGDALESKKPEGGKKISSELMPVARKLDGTLKDFKHDLEWFKGKMHESGLDSEFDKIKSEIRSRLSSFLS
jgi:hypothetical protein